MSVQELYAWNAYFEIKSEREEEAYDKAKRQAQVRKVRYTFNIRVFCKNQWHPNIA